MRLGGRRSDNVVDARGRSLPIVGGGIGMAVLALVVYLLGGDPSVVTNMTQPAPAGAPAGQGSPDPQVDFVSTVLADIEDTWTAVFREHGRTYEAPKLVVFSDAVQSACGIGQAAMGPFYCPRDRAVYLDLSFFRELRERFQAPGDFAQAYVIAHEVGHHVQNLLGIADEVGAAQQRSGRRGANALSVRMELQADCFAGLWAYHAARRNVVEPGDIEEALGAASAIGDDRLQKATQGHVVPESFTHGSSAQRVEWFRRGFDSGDVERCDTFQR
jgi:uncharacterized protein